MTSNCSINFTTSVQPKITLLFNTPSCINYIQIPSPSNVQQFAYSIYDENGTQLQPPGTLMSTVGDSPVIQPDPNICGYSAIVQLLSTKDSNPATHVTIDLGACFMNLSAMTTTTVEFSMD